MGDAYLSNSNYKGNKLGWGKKPALIVVDLCRAYYSPDSQNNLADASPEAAGVPDAILSLIASARKGSCPVIWTNVLRKKPYYLNGGLFGEKTGWKALFNEDDPRRLWEWLPNVQPEADDLVVTKPYPSAFFGTQLASQLTILGADTVVVCGVSTSGCVRATVLDALCHGFRPMVVREGCGDRNSAIQEGNLYDMNAKYADVVDLGSSSWVIWHTETE